MDGACAERKREGERRTAEKMSGAGRVCDVGSVCPGKPGSKDEYV